MIHVGRFAPSPSGNLHFGSLIGALASFLQAKSKGGFWHVRIDDIDPFRIVPGASESILHTLDAYHLYHDGEVVYQSTRLDMYQSFLDSLANDCFLCHCRRKDLLNMQVYPGFCRSQNHQPDNRLQATRIALPNQSITIDDYCQQSRTFNLSSEVGDFILKRSDKVFSYHLSTVVDDMALGVTEVIRGADLWTETPKQAYLYHHFQKPIPSFGHVPLALNRNGQKLSKQTKAKPIKTDQTSVRENLFKALVFLNHNPAKQFSTINAIDQVDDLLDWAITHWDIGRLKQH